ncbi:MAG: efflux RND transporter permease subunit [Pseudomonadales bacterium]
MIAQFARHPVAANLTMIGMIMAGLWALRVMPTQLDPPANFPMVWVDVVWEGASAEDIEALITTPIEQSLKNLSGVREIQSRSVNGTVNIGVYFEHGTDITLGVDQIKQRVASIRNFPAGMETPVVRRFIDLEPISWLTITGPGDLAELVPLIRSMETQLLARGVEGVMYDGLPAEEIALLVGGQRLRQIGMTLAELASAVRTSSQNVPAGSLGSGQGAMQLRSLDQQRSTEGFKQLTISTGTALVALGDIADVVRRAKPGQPYLTRDGQRAVQMMLWRDTSADAYLNAQIVEDWLAEVRPTLPKGVEIAVSTDVWQLLQAQLQMIAKNGTSGLMLVIGVLYLFLNARAGWWVMVGIPVSFLLGLSIFYLGFGYGISIVALIGLIMALGIVVDDAIVVGEDIVALHESGMSPDQAAVAGARRMFAPVVTSSLTTLAAFIPLLIVGGILGDVILALPTLMLCIILASLVECFLVLPGHLRTSLQRAKLDATSSWRQRFNQRFEAFRDERFMPLVDKAIDHPGTTLAAAGASVIVSVSLVATGHVGFNLVTGFDFESLEANVSFAASASPEQKQQFIAQLERGLQTVDDEHNKQNLLGWTTKHHIANFSGDRYTGDEYASVTAEYAFEEFRSLSPKAFLAQWQDKINQPPYVEQLSISVSGGAAGGAPDITLVLKGDELSTLKSGAEALAAALARFPGVSNVNDNLPYGKEQVIFSVLPAGLSLGLSASEVGAQLRAAYSGQRVQIFNEAEAELEVRVQLPDNERSDLSRLRQFPIATGNGSFVPLGNVADLQNRRGIDLIRHANGQMAVAVSADVDSEVTNALSLLNELKVEVLPGILDEYGLSYDLGGQSRSDAELLQIMQFGGLLTLGLVYLILVWAFSSYLWPLAIMLAIPFGFTGAVLGHWLMGWEIAAMSLLSFFSLTGIVVNDSIVLISFLRRELEQGSALKPALLLAVRARFRAVLLTSLTTIVGLAPLLFEHSTLSMYVSPIAITLCFGLSLATALVLIVIPAMLVLLEQSKARLHSVLSKHRPGATPAPRTPLDPVPSGP